MLSAELKAKADNTYQDLDYWECRKIPKISPGLTFLKGPFWGAYFWCGLYSERLMYGGKFAFQNRLGQLIIGRKCTIFALFYFVFEPQFPSTSPPGGLYSEESCNGGFFFLRWVWGLIFRGAYTRRSLFSEFYGITKTKSNKEEDRQWVQCIIIIIELYNYLKSYFSSIPFKVVEHSFAGGQR